MFPGLICIEFGVISTVRSAVLPAPIVKLIGTISLPFATTFSCAEDPSVKKARALLMSNMMPVTLPVGALVAPSKTLLFTRFVRLTFIPVDDETSNTHWLLGAEVLTFPWYFRTRLEMLTRRYLN